MNYLEALRDVTTFVFDVDGVMTNGQLLLTEDGKQLRTMHIRDGYAIRHALREGFRIAVISGAYSQGVAERFEYLGIHDIFLSVDDKVE
ncbi:MAG: 3-deoxy-D-manno-octulosonate 8-phosphate phosphatase, partial [Bacteroidota bacterium]